jgi:hypothetical protein
MFPRFLFGRMRLDEDPLDEQYDPTVRTLDLRPFAPPSDSDEEEGEQQSNEEQGEDVMEEEGEQQSDEEMMEEEGEQQSDGEMMDDENDSDF